MLLTRLNGFVMVNVGGVAPEGLLFLVDLTFNHVHLIVSTNEYLRITNINQLFDSHVVYDGWDAIFFCKPFLFLQLRIELQS